MNRNRDKNKSTPKANGPKDTNGYYLCGNCEKTHKGVCHKPVPGITSNKDNVPQAYNWMTKKAKNYIKKMVTDESKKQKMIQSKKIKRSYSSSSSESCGSEVESWSSGMTEVEQMYMLTSVGINPNDSDIEFPSNEEKRYRKQAKR